MLDIREATFGPESVLDIREKHLPSLDKTELSLVFLRRRASGLIWSQGALLKQLLLAVLGDTRVVFYTIYVLAEVFTPVY